MKKLIMALGASALISGASSCQGGAASSANNIVDKSTADSLAISFGEFFGQNLKSQEQQIQMQFGDKYNQASYMRGIEAALKLDTADVSYLIGYSSGMQAVFQMYQWAQSGIKVDPALLAKSLKKSMNDSLMSQQQAYMNFQMINSRVQQKIEEQQRVAKAAEAAENVKAGQEYVEKQKAADSDIKTSTTGLSYKIENEGTEPRIGENSNVKVIYTGRHIDGKEFDSSNGEPVTFNVNHVVVGFGEGLRMLGKGGKATLYIPGELGYGENGQPQGGIGPNEMLVFDIEVVDVEEPEPVK